MSKRKKRPRVNFIGKNVSWQEDAPDTPDTQENQGVVINIILEVRTPKGSIVLVEAKNVRVI